MENRNRGTAGCPLAGSTVRELVKGRRALLSIQLCQLVVATTSGQERLFAADRSGAEVAIGCISKGRWGLPRHVKQPGAPTWSMPWWSCLDIRHSGYSNISIAVGNPPSWAHRSWARSHLSNVFSEGGYTSLVDDGVYRTLRTPTSWNVSRDSLTSWALRE